MVIGVTQPRGVHHVQRHAVDVDMFAQDIAGGTGDVGNDRSLAPGKPVEQTGFAGIGTTSDHYRHAVTQ
ncbi:hypothetical protein D9M71_837320 [compost metagenome]